MPRERDPRASRGSRGRVLPRIDSGTPVPLGEYIFYGLAVLIGLAWFADFLVTIVIFQHSPSTAFTVLSGMVGTMMAGLVTVPRAYRRRNNDDDD